jgi:hypothetical protein
MEQAELERARQKFEDEVRALLAGTAIDKVELLQYGDDPEIEPGELLGRIAIALPEGADPDDPTARHQALEAFHDANFDVLKELRKSFSVTDFKAGVFVSDEPPAGHEERGPVIIMRMKPGGRRAAPGLGGDQPLTAVMARLGQEDLETLDTLIAAGIASSRAEAVRWALARIRERPAYEQIRARSREIEALKSQF